MEFICVQKLDTTNGQKKIINFVIFSLEIFVIEVVEI